ncbi:hypothetical protein POM88_003781 [Heracleum sosnowskyi]|uniref:Uncharacterized protein n=1 Tax=Heracleum sosnowskyi TaxID=360622 RepID=A0AAD8NDD4_9APIA|nr:hypothetical protein POM88_003781 [Heracleum sosnowskyi]
MNKAMCCGLLINSTTRTYIICLDHSSLQIAFRSFITYIPPDRVRVSNELGAGNGKGAKFATVVAVSTSTLMTNRSHTLYSLAFTNLLNSVQPILSGVAVGSGWQSYVAYINLSCYYLIGLPLGIAMGWIFNQGVMGIWAGMIFGGTFIQTLILALITIRCDWEKEAEKAVVHLKKWSGR